MWSFITDKFQNWFDSFNNQDSGWSRKKLTSYLITWSCYVSANLIYLDYAFSNKDFSLMPSVQTINAGLICALISGTDRASGSLLRPTPKTERIPMC